MPKPRIAGSNTRLLRAIPWLGDVIAATSELADPNYSPAQRVINALVVGGGGMLSSTATGGADFIPQAVDFVNDLRGGPKGPEKLKELQNCATVFNPDKHLRALATKVGPDKYSGFYETDFAQAAERCGNAQFPSGATEEQKMQSMKLRSQMMGMGF